MIGKLVERPIAVTMSLIAFMVLGIVAARMTPVSLMPDVPVPVISVQISAPGSSAREIDALMVRPLRYRLMQLENLEDMKAVSGDGSANISLRFAHGSDMDFTSVEVNEKIDQAMNTMPPMMERPKVMRSGITDIPAFFLNVTTKKNDGERRFLELSAFVSGIIVKRIEQLPEVAMVDVSGLVFPELLIVPDMAKIEAMGASVTEIENVIRRNDMDFGNLTIRDGEYRFNVRFESKLRSKSDIENIVMNINGRIYRLSELAEVVERPQSTGAIVRSNGKRAITVAVIKQSDAGMGELSRNLRQLADHLKKENPDLEIEFTRDQTQLLTYAINNMRDNIIMAAIFACMIIFLFIGNFRSSILISITIPSSLIISMLFFKIFGLSLNIISLSGLILGIGMMTDNSVIVIDNISQFWQRGFSLKDSVVRGASQVFTPMLSSVLTTCAIFLPLIFLSGIAGALFYDQAVAISISLFSSLAVSVLIIPVYFYLFFRNRNVMTENRFLARMNLNGRMSKLYEKTLKIFFRRRGVAWFMFVLSIPLCIFVYHLVEKQKLPVITQDDALMHIDWNATLTGEENDRRTAEVLTQAAPNAIQRTSMAGVQQFLLPHTRDLSLTEALVYFRMASPGALDSAKVAMGNYIASHYPQAKVAFHSSGNIFESIFSDDQPTLAAYLKPTGDETPDPARLNEMMAQIAARTPNMAYEPILWNENILLTANPERMVLYGVRYEDINTAIRGLLNQRSIMTVNSGDIRIPVVSGADREGMTDLLSGNILSSDSTRIPLRFLLTESRGRDLKEIHSRSDGNYYPLNIPVDGKDVMRTMRAIKETVNANPYFDVSFDGAYFSNKKLMGELIMVFVVAFLLLFFILAAQFESLVQPVIILMELVFDVLAVLVTLLVCGESLNLMSLIGIIVMCGIIINDSILKVDTINKLRKEGYTLLRAIIMAGARRLRPIVITSLTTIFAMVPFLRHGDMGNDLQFPLSIAIIAGMVVGTLCSIFILPIVYYTIYKKRSR